MSNVTVTATKQSDRVIRLPRDRRLIFDRPLVMGVLNITPDSFSDGGKYLDTATALRHAQQMIEQGADIIDIGGESSRPGAQPVTVDEELSRVLPVITALRHESDIPISIDTYHAATASAALDAGADIVNDISALRFDADMVNILQKYDIPIILMHMLGTPSDMQRDPVYSDCVIEIAEFFHDRINFCLQHGIDSDRIILDPGIGFGKRVSDNLEILGRLREFRQFGLPVMVGASRKSFIGNVHPTGRPAEKRIGGSLAAAVVAVQNGADIVRVHDVAETVEALKIIGAVRAST